MEVENKKMEIEREQEKVLFAVLFRALVFETNMQKARDMPDERSNQILETTREFFLKITKDLGWEYKLTKTNCSMLGIEKPIELELRKCVEIKIPIVEQLTG